MGQKRYEIALKSSKIARDLSGRRPKTKFRCQNVLTPNNLRGIDKMKTKLAISAIAAAFVLSACGSKTEAPAPAAEAPPPAAAPMAADASTAAADAATAAAAASSAASAAKP